MLFHDLGNHLVLAQTKKSQILIWDQKPPRVCIDNRIYDELIDSSGFAPSDVLRFDQEENYGTDFAANGTPTDNGISIVRGTYDTATKVFTVNDSVTSATTGYASLVIYDADRTVDTTVFKGIVLVGYLTADDPAFGTNADNVTGLVGTGT